MKLSILILSLYSRVDFLKNLLEIIARQDTQCLSQTEVLISSDNGTKTIGGKRNELLRVAHGEYVVFCDDDDEISDDYLERIFEGIRQDVDHVGIAMLYNPDNGPKKKVLCSKNHIWEEKNGVYLRGAQHVCPIKTEIARKVVYPEINFGEDHAYGNKINQYIETEFLIEEPIYFYNFRSNKTK